jgi:hypothetical protein
MGTFLYLEFGGLLPLCLYVCDVLPPRLAVPVEKVGTAAAFVGLYSPWMYLWQGVFGCVIFGVVMARLIEFPVLKLRDRIFPPVTSSVTPPPPVENPYEALTLSKNA